MKDYELIDLSLETSETTPDTWVIIVTYSYVEEAEYARIEFHDTPQYQRVLTHDIANKHVANHWLNLLEKNSTLLDRLMHKESYGEQLIT